MLFRVIESPKIHSEGDPPWAKKFFVVKFSAFSQCCHPFDRVKYGRVSRQVFWTTMAADGVLLIVVFLGPLEAAYRLQADPQGWFIRGWLLGLGWLAVTLAVCAFRLARRRLHDAAVSGWAMLWAAVPVIGWLWLIRLLVRPSFSGKTRFDEERQKSLSSKPLSS